MRSPWVVAALVVCGAARLASGEEIPRPLTSPATTSAETTRRATLGIDRVEVAAPLPAGEVILGASADYFTAGGLFQAGDRHRRAGWLGVLGLSVWGPLDFALGWSSTSNTNTPGLAQPTQTTGDPTLTTKASFALPDGVGAGASVQLGIPTSIGGNGLAPSAFVLTGLGIVSYAPIANALVAFNAGYRLDQSRKLFLRDPPPEIDALMRFGANVARSNAALASFGALYRVEVTNAVRLSPFVELSGAFSPGAAAAENPLRATLGLKGFLRASAIELCLAGDVRLHGAPVADGKLPGLPPWELHAGVAIHLPESSREPRAKEIAKCEAPTTCSEATPCAAPQACVDGRCLLVKEVEKDVVREPAPTFIVTGTVTNALDKKPIAGASVTLSGFDDIGLATDKDGRWKSWPLPVDVGLLQVSVTAPGYKPGKQTLPKGPANTIRQLPLALTSIDSKVPGQLRGQLNDQASGNPLGGLITVPAQKKKVEVGAEGTFTVELPAGRYTIIISNPRYQTQTKEITIGAGEVVILNIDLTKRR